MNAAYSLPDRLDVYADESLAGYIMRCAEIYGFKRPELLFARLGQTRRSVQAFAGLDPASPDGQAVACLLHLEAEFRRMSSWHPDPSSFTLCGHRIHVDLMNSSSRQVCPRCLENARYHRAEWLLSALPVCTVHRVRMIDRCPQCSEPLIWRGRGVHLCSSPACDFDLRCSRAEELTSEQAAAASGLFQLLKGESHPGGMSFEGALRATLVLGRIRLSLPGWGSGRVARFLAERRAELPELLATGWTSFNPWPAAFQSYLEDLLRSSVGGQTRGGLNRAFGPLMAAIRKTMKAGWGRPLVAAMTDLAMSRTEVAVKRHVALRHSTERHDMRQYMSLSEAAQLLGVSTDTMTRTAARLGLHAGGNPDPGQQRALLAEEVRRLARAQVENADAMTALDAAAMLAVSPPTFHALVRLSLVQEIPSNERVKAKLRFRRSDLEALLATFERASVDTPRLAMPGTQHRALGRGGTRDGFGIVGIADAVLSGRLKPVAVWITAPGLQRYLFPRTIRLD